MIRDFEAHREILYKLFTRYSLSLQNAGHVARDWQNTSPQHALWLCRHALSVAYVAPIDKLNRWLGFVQACCIAADLTTVQDERDYTRAYLTGVEILD